MEAVWSEGCQHKKLPSVEPLALPIRYFPGQCKSLNSHQSTALRSSIIIRVDSIEKSWELLVAAVPFRTSASALLQ